MQHERGHPNAQSFGCVKMLLKPFLNLLLL